MVFVDQADRTATAIVPPLQRFVVVWLYVCTTADTSRLDFLNQGGEQCPGIPGGITHLPIAPPHRLDRAN